MKPPVTLKKIASRPCLGTRFSKVAGGSFFALASSVLIVVGLLNGPALAGGGGLVTRPSGSMGAVQVSSAGSFGSDPAVWIDTATHHLHANVSGTATTASSATYATTSSSASYATTSSSSSFATNATTATYALTSGSGGETVVGTNGIVVAGSSGAVNVSGENLLTSSSATATYQPIGSYQAAGSYLTSSSAAATYLQLSSAAATYVQPGTLTGYVPTSRTVAGHALSSNVSLSAADVGLGSVDNTSDASKPISTAQAAVNASLAASTTSTAGTLATLAASTTSLAASTGAIATSTAALAAQLIQVAADTTTINSNLSGYVPTSRTVAGHALSSNVTVSASDVGLGNVTNTSDANKPISTAQQTQFTAVASATGTLTTSIASVAVDTGTLSTSTASLRTQLNQVATDTSTIATNSLTTSSATATYLQSSSATLTYVSKTVTVAGHALSGPVTIAAADIASGTLGASVLSSSNSVGALLPLLKAGTNINLVRTADGSGVTINESTAGTGSQTPLTADVNASTFSLLNVSSISFANQGQPWVLNASTHSSINSQSNIVNGSTNTFPNLQFYVAPNSTCTFTAKLCWNSSSGTSAGVKFSMTGPAGSTKVNWMLNGAATSTTGNWVQNQNVFGSLSATAINTSTSQTWMDDVAGQITTGAVGGYVNFQIVLMGSNSGTCTFQQGSQVEAHLDPR